MKSAIGSAAAPSRPGLVRQRGSSHVGGTEDRPADEGVRVVVRTEQLLDALSQFGIVQALAIEHAGTVGRSRMFNGQQENRL